MPQSAAVGHVVEGEDLLHAAVAVGRDDEDRSSRAGAVGSDDSHHDIVMKLALLPVIEEFVATATSTQFFEKRAENERIGQLLNGNPHR